MCGIFGVLDWLRGVDIATGVRASRALRHRGPDDEGFLLADWRSQLAHSFSGPDTADALHLPRLESAEGKYGLLLAHRRLSIIDVSTAGHQPMSACNARLWIIYNGEIYNYLELREELRGQGYSFHTGSDTEVILAAYHAWGAKALNRFVGMFAFGILDLQDRTLFLARDFFGIKPLYYTQTTSGFAFSSEIPPLLELPGVKRRADPRGIYDYLRFGFTDQGDQTMFADIRQLPAAHHMTLNLGQAGGLPRPERYWQLRVEPPRKLSFDDASKHLKDLFLKNVRLHLRSDVPLGACLSGGIDSSAIVAAMRAVGGAELDLNTFTYVASDAQLNEERWADLVASATASAMHKVRVSAHEMAEDLDDLIALQGEPFGSTSIYAQNRVFRLARESGLKVMLDGQGADELFFGYAIFHSLRVAALVNAGRLAEALAFARRASHDGVRFSSVLLHAGGRLTPGWLQPTLMGLIGQPPEPKWMNQTWFRRHAVTLVTPDWRRGDDMPRMESLRALFQTSLPGLLRYEDRNSMAYSIESRVPFLTPELAEFVISLPDEYLLSRHALTKSVLRDSLRGLVPDPVLDRRDKVGFETPQSAWLSELRPHVEATLRSASLDRVSALDARRVRAESPQQFNAHRLTRPLWAWYNLARWADSVDVDFDA